MVDFDNNTEEDDVKADAAKQAAEAAKKASGDEEKQGGFSADSEDDYEFDSVESSQDTAISFMETDDYIFTSEGMISKENLSNSGKDNSGNSEPKEGDEKILGKFDSYEDLKKSYKELESKIGEKDEAAEKLRELNPVLPMLEAMLGDETFLDMAEQYFTDPKAKSEAIKKQIGLDDNFQFDLDTALTDPKSQDAKVLNKLMSAKEPSKKQPPQTKKSQQSQTKIDKDAEEFMKKYDMKPEEYKEMMSRAKDYKISHEDIYFLMNKDKVIQDRIKKANEEKKNQMDTAKKYRKSPSGGGNQSKRSAEDAFIDSLGVGKGIFE